MNDIKPEINIERYMRTIHLCLTAMGVSILVLVGLTIACMYAIGKYNPRIAEIPTRWSGYNEASVVSSNGALYVNSLNVELGFCEGGRVIWKISDKK